MAAGGSWAQVAEAEPPKPQTPQQACTATAQPTAVVDANAIVSGVQLVGLAERLVTIPEVLEEVRDVRSRERLAALPVPLQTLQPTEEALAAVTRFARATGDLHSLSAVDLRLVALAYTLEAAAHGTAHLRELPPPPRVKGRVQHSDAKRLPGWGQSGGKWSQLDRLDEEAEAAAAAASGTAAPDAAGAGAAVGAQAQADGTEPAARSAVSQAAGPSAAERDAVSHISKGVQAIDLSRERGFGSDAGDSSESADEDLPDAGASAAADQQQGSEDEGEWETAASSKNAARRKKRKDIKYHQRQAARAAQDLQQSTQTSPMGSESESEWMSDDGSEDSGAEEREEENASEATPESSSSVVSLTADFSMQNVILQMGLRLSTPDGRRITHISRFVLRCSACFFITKEAGRLFCPRCGNAALEKVEVTTAADGQEQYGIRKKHNLRGTRFSLPKPKGGRQAGAPVLREDVMLQRMPHMRAGQQSRAPASVDPFAPELHGPDYWFQQGGSRDGAARHAKGAAAILAAWKHNPNERKHVRTNRRRK